MSDPPISTMMANTIRFTASYTATITDADGVRVVTFFPTATTDAPVFGRFLLADPDDVGATEETALELIGYLNGVISLGNSGGGYFSTAMNSSGKLVITYSPGGTDTASIVWTTSTAIRNLMGFTGTVSVPDTTPQTATNQPTHCAFAFNVAAESDTSWTPLPSQSAGADTEDGRTYVWSGNKHRVFRSFDLRMLPTDYATKASIPSDATQLWPYGATGQAAHALMVSPTQSIGAAVWSWYETIRTAYTDGTNCGALGLVVGTFQTARGHSGECDLVYLTSKCHTSEKPVRPTKAGWGARRDWASLEMTRVDVLDIS